ncbi:MAG: FAD-dependent oxidoreductase [Chitinivibrionales bacterium]|nr:FAD-dependent oxidoreductase [Chitinivibrionales bacterium]
MKKLNTFDDFLVLSQQLQKSIDAAKPTIIISAGTCGQASGANDVIRIVKHELIERNLTDAINLRITGCIGFCEMEPSVLVEPTGVFYPKITMHMVPRIITAIAENTVCEELLFHDNETGKPIVKKNDIPFFKGQLRLVLDQNEKVDPIRIHDYIRCNGYMPLLTLLRDKKPAEVIGEVKRSGLRGRGGAGFSTGVKWSLLAKESNSRGKIIVCNADEGDPGAYMDRSVLEGNPHRIIEGMLIGGYATGASEGIVYVRDEYPLAVKHLTIAIRQAQELGLLGNNIMGTGFSFSLQIVRGAGAFVCGEETALMRSIEGKTGEPTQKPPFPTHKGIYNRPTLINNVETWANVPVIFEMGVDKYLTIGTPNNSGTKIFSLVGKVKYTGLVEVPMGTPLKKILYDIGGGPSGNARIKAIQTGGPSGGAIPRSLFNLNVDYDSLVAAGSIMGSGGMIVMDEHTCMVDVAKYYLNFLKNESCGKCFTCRKGTQRMYELLEDITKGVATEETITLLEQLATVVRDTTQCGLGNTAANPVLSTLRYFRHEYNDHIMRRRCDAGVCKDLVGAPCQNACPLGTEVWRYVASIERGEYAEALSAIVRTNPLPSVCARVCNHPCESYCKLATTGGSPMAIRTLKRFVVDKVELPVSKKQPRRTKDSIGIIGAGPAGLSAAYFLAKDGYPVTLYESQKEPGGMLISAIPEHRLPRDRLRRDIDRILAEGVELKTATPVSVKELLSKGHKAVFVAIGAHKSMPLGIAGENVSGVIAAMQFLSSYNLKGEKLARGRVGIIGGGNSAIDAARVAIRFDAVESVTVFYRRTEKEMPAYREEIEAAKEEGVTIETLLSPIKIGTKNGKLSAVEFAKNALGETDEYGRRQPAPIGKETVSFNLDTLIVAIGEQVESETVCSGMEITRGKSGVITVDKNTLATAMVGVFAGGDCVTGPNTVVEAIANGMKAADVIGRFLAGQPLEKKGTIVIANHYIPRSDTTITDTGEEPAKRVEPPQLEVDKRKHSHDEVELSIAEAGALRESRRCLRCDLEFTECAANVKCTAEKAL